MSQSKKLLILVGSPRRDGNTATLAKAVNDGGKKAGLEVSLRFIDDYMQSFLHDCRQCRRSNGECSVDDRYDSLFNDDFLNADGVIFCTPIYFYGMSAQTKAFFDRSFCYYSESYPQFEKVIEKMSHKRVGLVVVSEETFPTVSQGIIHQIQEYSRYTNSTFVGVVHGVGNSRGEVINDPDSPLKKAEKLGKYFFERKFTDYRLDTVRDNKVW